MSSKLGITERKYFGLLFEDEQKVQVWYLLTHSCTCICHQFSDVGLALANNVDGLKLIKHDALFTIIYTLFGLFGYCV